MRDYLFFFFFLDNILEGTHGNYLLKSISFTSCSLPLTLANYIPEDMIGPVVSYIFQLYHSIFFVLFPHLSQKLTLKKCLSISTTAPVNKCKKEVI